MFFGFFISDLAEELEVLEEVALLAGVDIAMATRQSKAPYKACYSLC
jgi:hypothetical protein